MPSTNKTGSRSDKHSLYLDGTNHPIMKNPIFFYGIFALIGLPCFILALYFTYSTVRDSATYEQAQGTITDFNGSSYPNVSFTYQGQTYSFHSNYQSSDMQAGDEVTVSFPPGNPNDASIKDFFTDWFLPLFLGLFGLVFGGVGGGGIYFQLKKSNLKKELFDEARGKKIAADLTGAGLDMSYRVNGRSPYVISAQWLDVSTNHMYLFNSDYIWFDPTSMIEGRKKIDVYIDENDPKRYYVDISFLPQTD